MKFFKNTNEQIKFENNRIYFKAEEKNSYFLVDIGMCDKVKNFAAVFRNDVYFQRVKTGKSINDIPTETQWLLIEFTDNTYLIIVPLVDEPYRCAIRCKEEKLCIYCETGDEATEIDEAVLAYYTEGNNPYKMMEQAAKEIADMLPDLRIRTDKAIPEFIKYFGWCTWDSFYEKVTAEDVKKGLENFKEGGIVPGLVILDDGWQSVEPVSEDRGKHQLSSFKANEKFNNDLTPTVKMAKDDFGVKIFMVWHAVMGYWGGVYPKSAEMSDFNVKLKTENHSSTMYEVNPKYSESLHFPYGFINPKKAFDFYNSYHTHLRHEGVDGVKVDVQAAIEALGYAEGGRVSVVKSFRKGLEASVNRNFKGNLINCMSCSNDHILNTLSSVVMRSSDDFFPSQPQSHGVHILRNAFASMFMGEFLICDWDMFQTKHEFGKFHAASRAISGSPVYVSDRVGEHDFDVIDKLIMADSVLPLCTRNARPTADSLFIDSENRNEIFKIFNYNKYTGVIGAFNLTSDEDLSKTISPCDVDGFDDGEYAVYDSKNDVMVKMESNDIVNCNLKPIDFNIYTVTKITNMTAPIGLVNKYNCGGTILSYERFENNLSLTVGDGGQLLIYSEKKPEKVIVNGKAHDYDYSSSSLKINLENKQINKVYIVI